LEGRLYAELLERLQEEGDLQRRAAPTASRSSSTASIR
jgi:hypothetical protein